MPYAGKLELGLPVELFILGSPNEEKYRTHVEEVGEKILVVNAPYVKGEIVPLREGTRLKLTYWDELSAYTFETVIMQRIAVPYPTFVLALPTSVTKIQRRNFVRITVNFPFSFRVVLQNGLSDFFEGIITDLSGGGIQFKTKKVMEKGYLLTADINLPNSVLEMPLRVVRSESVEKQPGWYVVSSEFFDISERIRDDVIRCVFEIQREMRKKGLM